MSALTDDPGRACGTCCHWRMPLHYLSPTSECLVRGGGRTAVAETCDHWAGDGSHLPDGLQGMVGAKRWAV